MHIKAYGTRSIARFSHYRRFGCVLNLVKFNLNQVAICKIELVRLFFMLNLFERKYVLLKYLLVYSKN